jgi:hypothetical protein
MVAFFPEIAEEKGVQYAKEASGHKSDRYIWRYVKPNQEILAAADKKTGPFVAQPPFYSPCVQVRDLWITNSVRFL